MPEASDEALSETKRLIIEAYKEVQPELAGRLGALANREFGQIISQVQDEISKIDNPFLKSAANSALTYGKQQAASEFLKYLSKYQ